MIKSHKLLAILSISLFLVSMIGVSAGPIPENTITNLNSESRFKVSQTNNTPPGDLNVFWDQHNENDTGSWNWTNRDWIFGPNPEYRIYYQNGTEIEYLETIPIQNTIIFNITIPRHLLGGKSIFETYIDASSYSYDPDTQIQRDIYIRFGYQNYTSEPWYSYTYVNIYNISGESNSSRASMFSEPPEKTLIAQYQDSFFEIDQPHCAISIDPDNIRIKIVGYFTNDTIRTGYYSELAITDTDYNSYWGSTIRRLLPIGISADEAFIESHAGMFTLEKYDLSGEPIYSATRGQEFTFRINVTARSLSYVVLSLDMPYSTKAPVTVYGWYKQVIHETGGWVYNDTLQCYVYDPNANVTIVREVYGPHTEYRDIYLNNYVNFINYYYNYENHTVEPYNDTAYLQYLYIYNESDGTFGSYIGYTYWGYDPGVGEYTFHYNITPISSEDFTIFELTDVSVANTTHGWTVTFTGNFTMDAERGQVYRFTPKVFDEHMNELQPAAYAQPADDPNNPSSSKMSVLQTPSEFEQAQQIAVETPITIAKITKVDGNPTGSWFAHVDPGVPFLVQSYVQGASDIASDIDGAAFDLRAWDSKYGENESIYSELNYILHILRDNTTEILAFNYTQKWNYTYGEHWEWVEVNKTDWHYEWNSTVGDYVWVYGPFTSWEYQKVEGWYFASYAYDQSQQKWIENANFDALSYQTKVNVSIFTINDAYILDTPTIDVFFNLTINSLAPQTSYMWNVYYLNNTWMIDPSQGWGEHVVTAWHIEPVWTSEWTGEYFGTPKAGYFYEYNGQQYLSYESPYIVINNEKVYIQEYISMDGSGMSDNRLLYEEFNETSGMWMNYYLGLDDTKYYVYQEDRGVIFNVTLPSVGKSFYAINGRYMFNPFLKEFNDKPYTWTLLNGTILAFGSYEISGYNYTPVNYVVVDKTQFARQVSIVNGSYYMEFRFLFWDSIQELYYVITLANNRYNIYNDPSYGAYFDANGTRYYITFPMDAYPVDINGTKLYYFWDSLAPYFYTIVNGTQYQIPKPGSKVFDTYGLDHTVSHGGFVPVTTYIVINGTEYEIVKINGTSYVIIGNSTEPVYDIGWLRYFEDCNGQIFTLYSGLLTQYGISGPEETNDGIGVTALYGKLSVMNNDLPDNSLPLHITGYLDINKTASTYHGYDPSYVNGSEYIILFNGTKYTVYYGSSVAVYKVIIKGKTYFGYFDYLDYNNTDGTYYYKLINGTIIHFDQWTPVQIDNIFVYTIFYKTLIGPNGTYNQYYYLINGTPYILFEDFDNSYSIGELYLPDVQVYNYEFINSSSADDRCVVAKPTGMSYLQVYGLNATNGIELLIPRYDYVYSKIKIWGWAYVYGPKPLDFRTIKSQQELIIGVPQYDMWNFRAWKKTDTGAVDLDGDLATTDDQYYILSEYTSSDEWKFNSSSLFVDIWWNPNGTTTGDEVHIRSFMGLATQAWRFSWEYRFFWYHASDFTPVNATEMAEINATIISSTGDPNPGYWRLAWYVKNMTWSDIVQEAHDKGWDWIQDDWQTWSWIWFGFDESYGTAMGTNTSYTYTAIRMRYEFAGFLIYNDTNNNGIIDVNPDNISSSEVTHYLIPDGVDAVSFVLPGEMYGCYNLTGHLTLNVTDPLIFGITYYNVSGTFFPFGHGYWDWYSGMIDSDLLTFDERPTDTVIDQLSFIVHFNGYITQSLNNRFELKVDQHIGNFDVDITGGRAVLENRSLGISYYAEASLSQTYQVFGTNGAEVNNNQNTISSSLSFGSGNSVFAEMILGGNTYDWAKNMTAPINVTSTITPIGAFEATYESEGGNSVTSFTITQNQYYVTIGFPKWDGFAVFQDPAYVGYSSGQGSGGTTNPSAPTISDIQISNPSPAEYEDVTIYATVTDPDGVQWVRLEYSTDGGFTWNSVDMQNMGNDAYQGTIPGQPAGTEVRYRIHAADNLNNEQFSASFSYVVASGTSSSTSSGTSSNTGTEPNLPNIPTDLLIGGALLGAAMIILIVIIAKKRRG